MCREHLSKILGPWYMRALLIGWPLLVGRGMRTRSDKLLGTRNRETHRVFGVVDDDVESSMTTAIGLPGLDVDVV